VTYTIKPTSATSGTITATAKKVTLWTSNGTLSGTGTATLHITNQPKAGDDTVTNGKIKLTHGTGAGRPFTRGHVNRLGQHSQRPIRVPLQGDL
jgi:hypothetical protein